MVESPLITPLHFTVEFVGFLIAAGAAALLPTALSPVNGPRSRRIVAAVGFAVLAAAQAAHGAEFVATDGDTVLMVARTTAVLLIAAGLFGAPRRAAGAGAAITYDPLLLAPAAGWLLVAGAALRHRDRDGGAAYRLALTGVLLASSESLIALIPEARIGIGGADPLLYVAHGLKLAGFTAAAVWVWSGVRSSIRTRFVAAFGVLLVVVVLALSSTLTGIITANIESEELKRMTAQLHSAVRNIEGSVDGVTRNVEIIGASAVVKGTFASDRSLGPLARGFVTEKTFDLDFVLFTSPRGKLLAFFGRPQVRDEGAPASPRKADVVALLGSGVLSDVTKGPSPVAASVDRLGEHAIAALAATEIADVETPAQVAGIMLAGRYLDARTTEEISEEFDPSVATLVADREVIASELPRGIAPGSLISQSVRVEVAAGESLAEEQTLSGRLFYSAFAPIENEVGVPVATLVLSSPARVVTATRTAVTRSLFLVALTAGAAALVLAYLSGRRISRPIRDLTSAATAVREGDLSIRAPVGGHDEVGRLGETFNEMTAALRALTGDLRRSAEEEQELRARIEAIVESMADGLVAVDAASRVLAFNVQAELLTGITADDALGKPLQRVLDVRDAQGNEVPLPIHELAEGSVGGVYLTRKAGQPLPVAITCAVLRGDEDLPAGGVAVIRDVSREYVIEKMKTEFLSNISHELRTPLTPIKGYAELLARKGVPPEKAHRFAIGILDSSRRLERMVALLVDFSAIEAGRLAPQSAPVDLGTVIDAAVGDRRSRDTDHEFIVRVEPGVHAVAGDERLLRRALEEVLDNAVKFSPEGGRVVVEASSSSIEGRNAVVVRVVDQGIGIPPENLERIFSDFQQLDGSETRTFGGLGLGLAFVNRIVEVHGGLIDVQSTLGAGTSFAMTIPSASRLVKAARTSSEERAETGSEHSAPALGVAPEGDPRGETREDEEEGGAEARSEEPPGYGLGPR